MDKIMIILEQQLISYSVGAATTLGRYRRLRHQQCDLILQTLATWANFQLFLANFQLFLANF